MTEVSVDVLIRQLQSTSDAAQRRALFDLVVRYHQPPAYAYAFSLLGDAQMAEDATQEAFLLAYQRLGQLRQAEAFGGWLRRIVHSQCRRLLRDRQYPSLLLELPAELPSAQPSPAVLVEQAEMHQRIRAAVAALPDIEQTPVALHYFGEQSQREIAERMNLSLAAVKKRLERGRRRLAERMQEMAQEYRTTRQNQPESLSALLSAAALEGQFVLLETLLVEGMDVDERDVHGETLLHWAARQGHLDAVDLLLGYHPDLNCRDASGRTALDLAVEAGQRAVAARLRQVAQGADRNEAPDQP